MTVILSRFVFMGLATGIEPAPEAIQRAPPTMGTSPSVVTVDSVVKSSTDREYQIIPIIVKH